MNFFTGLYNKIGDVASGAVNFFKDIPNKVSKIGDTVIGYVNTNVIPKIGDIATAVPSFIQKGVYNAVDTLTTVSDKLSYQTGKSISNIFGSKDSNTGVSASLGANINSIFNTSGYVGPLLIGGVVLGGLLLLKV